MIAALQHANLVSSPGLDLPRIDAQRRIQPPGRRDPLPSDGPPSHAATRCRSKARASVEFLKATRGAPTGRRRSRCACKIVAVGWALREGERP